MTILDINLTGVLGGKTAKALSKAFAGPRTGESS
jgi:hypothetical protein